MECKQACLLEEDLPAGCQFETTFALDSSEAGWDLHKSWGFHFWGGLREPPMFYRFFKDWFSQKKVLSMELFWRISNSK